MALTSLQDTEQIERQLKEFVTLTDELKIKYEQYFLGLIKEEPFQMREKAKKMARDYYTTAIQNAGLKFRFAQALAKYNTYSTLWDRTLKQIEEGSYQRDLFKARLRSQSHSKTAPKTSSERTKSKEIHRLYDDYQKALGKKLDFGAFERNIAPKIMAIKERTKEKDIHIKIVREGEKIRVKAFRKKESSS
ncbi:MAG: hypothetical protein R3A11_08205 [Bdellovibrionota bacterium]